jgi:hypothetical protein
MTQDDLPTRAARSANGLASLGLALSVASFGAVLAMSVAPTVLPIVALLLLALAIITSAWALLITRHCLTPRPPAPMIAMLLSLVLAGVYGYMAWAFMQLSRMH